MPKAPLFRIGPYWGGYVPGSKNIYCHWYDAGTGEVRKRTLKTTDIGEAEKTTAALWIKESQSKAREPRDVMLLTVLERYWVEHSDHRPNPATARRAGSLLLDYLEDDAAKLSQLTRPTQRAFIKHLHETHHLGVSYICRIQAVINAALNRAKKEDDDGMLPGIPHIIVAMSEVSQLLDQPEPLPDNWHPTLEQVAEFMDAATTEAVLRMAILTLAFAGRPLAVETATAAQFDARHGLIAWNPEGRRQTKKYRATVPVPPVLMPHLKRWVSEGGRLVGGRVREPWQATKEAVGAHEKFRPKCLRHLMATEMRKRGVIQEQRETWMGHRRHCANDHYGVFTPEFLYGPRDCANAVLVEVERLCKLPMYRQIPLKHGARNVGIDLVRVDPIYLDKVDEEPKVA